MLSTGQLQRTRSCNKQPKTYVLLPAFRRSSSKTKRWSLKKVQVLAPQWQAFMRGAVQTAFNIEQEETIMEIDAIASHMDSLRKSICELSKETVQLLQTLDPTGDFTSSSAEPSHQADPCLKGILHGLAALESERISSS